VLAEARAVDHAGTFAKVVEGVSGELAEEITRSIPTVDIGASLGCDGQILVTDDMVGTSTGRRSAPLRQGARPHCPSWSKLMRPTCQAARFRCAPKCTALPPHQRRSGHERK
jgi:hypothetical protein